MSARFSPRSRRHRQSVMGRPADAILRAYQSEFEQMFQPVLHERWCIEAAPITQFALAQLGIPATVLFTRLRSMNAAAMRANLGRLVQVPEGQTLSTRSLGWVQRALSLDSEPLSDGHVAVDLIRNRALAGVALETIEHSLRAEITAGRQNPVRLTQMADCFGTHEVQTVVALSFFRRRRGADDPARHPSLGRPTHLGTVRP